MTMPGYVVPVDAIVDVGVLAIGGVAAGWSPTDGGLTWDPGKKVRHPDWDGRSFEHEGMHRTTGYDAKLTGKLKRGFTLDFEPGAESDGSSGSDGNVVTLLDARLPWSEGMYLEDIYHICQQQDGLIYRLKFRRGYVKDYKLVTKDNDEGVWDVTIVPVKPADEIQTPYGVPFTYQLVTPSP